MEAARVQTKFKMLFEKIAEPNYVINSYYTDNLINKMLDASDPDTADLISLPVLPNLLIEALKYTTNYHNTVNVFIGRMLAIVFRNEVHCSSIIDKHYDGLLETFTNLPSKNMNPSLKVAYLEIAMSLLTHRTGVNWLLKTEVWRHILSLYDKTITVFVLRLMYKFSAEFVWKLNDYDDEENLNTVITFIMQPEFEGELLNTFAYSLSTEEEEELCEKYEPKLQMLLSIVSYKDRLYYENKIARPLLDERCITQQLCILLERVRNERSVLLIAKIIFYMTLLKIFQAKPYKPDQVYTVEDFLELGVKYFNTVQFMIQRRNVILILDYGGICNGVWTTASKTVQMVPLLDQGKKMEFLNQMLLIHLVPMLVYVYTTPTDPLSNENIEHYGIKFLNMGCEHTTRAAYSMRDLVMELDMSYVGLQSAKRLTSLKDRLNDYQANVVFQALFIGLSKYDPLDGYGELKKTEETFEESEQKLLIMTYIIEIVLSIVKNYNINWHNSMEVISLNSVIHNILMKRTNLTFKFAVAALNLLTVSVSKFLPPNLSLLMETRPGCAMHEIGTLIFTKVHDLHWEVRDSALELLHVCTEISYIKFPPLQKQIIEKNLINLAVTIALNDNEAYVQVTALRCVAAASRVAALWEQVVAEHPDLADKLIYILRNNQEGIVRKEVCNVFCEMYQSGKFSPALKQALYTHMVSAAMSDFHWETQITTLKFWKIVIQFFLTDQGMLDGTFPPVTFSRESRKIVNLNETEIRKRLLWVLDDLASIGCLTVLLKLLYNEETEVEVMEAALEVAQDLHTILQTYKVPEHVKPVEGEPTTMAELVCHIKEDCESQNGANVQSEEPIGSENVIEDILKADDMNLLSSIYQKGMNIKNEVPSTPKLDLVKKASPYLFVSFMETTDCKKVISHKREWKEGIRSISSLLDDVLGLYDTNEDYNNLDCY